MDGWMGASVYVIYQREYIEKQVDWWMDGYKQNVFVDGWEDGQTFRQIDRYDRWIDKGPRSIDRQLYENQKGATPIDRWKDRSVD